MTGPSKPEYGPQERSAADVRRWSEAHAAVKRAGAVSWPQALREARALTEDQLDVAAQGCSELTCIYHGAVNHVRHERRMGQWSA